MIVKKLYRRIKSRWWDAEREVFKDTTVTDYVGWFLFGFIPIYLIELDKYEDVNFKDCGEGIIRYEINERYKHLVKGKEYADCKR